MRVAALIACLAVAGDVCAQRLPDAPISVANGRVVFGAEVVATFGSSDPGFFNYTDYEYNALRNFRLGLATEVRASSRLQVLAEIRLDHGDRLTPYALFVRIRPWPERRFDIQAGRVPPTFGAFTRTVYAYDNLVIGQPLAYQYLLSPQPDAIPGTSNDVHRMRGRGWESDFPLGNTAPSPGLSIVSTARYDTGLQVHGVAGMVEWIGSVTTGSLSDPLVADNNGRPQVAGRVIVEPTAGLRLGASAARAAWLDSDIDDVLPDTLSVSDARQSAVAADAAYSLGRWLVRGEVMRASWTLPAVSLPAVDRPLVARSAIVEGRYRLWPGVSIAARADRLWFSRLEGTAGNLPWEADIDRLEVALSVSIRRNIVAKGAWQRNRRSGGRIRHDSIGAAQLVYWF